MAGERVRMSGVVGGVVHHVDVGETNHANNEYAKRHGQQRLDDHAGLTGKRNGGGDGIGMGRLHAVLLLGRQARQSRNAPARIPGKARGCHPSRHSQFHIWPTASDPRVPSGRSKECSASGRFAGPQRSPTAVPGVATMIRKLGAIVGAAGKADMLSTDLWQRLGLEPFRIAPGRRRGPRSLTDRFCRQLPGRGLNWNQGLAICETATLAERGLACDAANR